MRISFALRWIAALAFLGPGVAGAASPCGEIVTFADNAQPRRQLFVSPQGDDSTGDGSRESPFQTVQRAARGIRPGDAVRLLPGDYRAGVHIAKIAGTADAPIWIGGEPGQPRPRFTDGASIHISRARFLVIENLEVIKARANGINCDDGGEFGDPEATRHVIFRNLLISDNGSGGNQDGLKLSGVNDFFVLDCEFARISLNGSGIDHVGCHRGVVARCVFKEGGNSVQCKGGSEDIEIRANRFLNPAGRAINAGGSTGLMLFRPPLAKDAPNAEARNIRVIANLFVGSEVPVAFVGAVQSMAANNTIINPNRYIVRILQETVSRDGFTFLSCGENQFVNNIVYFDSRRVGLPINVGGNTDPASFQFANNFWYAHDRPDRSRVSLPVAESDGIYGIDPRFKDEPDGEYSLSSASPALGNGKAIQNARGDLIGNCFSAPPSIGAWEARANSGR